MLPGLYFSFLKNKKYNKITEITKIIKHIDTKISGIFININIFFILENISCIKIYCTGLLDLSLYKTKKTIPIIKKNKLNILF